MPDLATDLLIESRYRLLENLGEGANGQVWKAEECTLARIVALKFVHLDSGVRDLRKRFENEGKVLANLEDPNIVQFLRFSVWQEQPFIVLEYVQGRTLRAVLDEVKRLPYERALRIASQMCGAAMAAHAHGVVHRDFKPSNIMISDGDLVKVVDFGIAKTLQAAQTGPGATSSNAAVGSVKYMSPEQCINGQVDYRADLYSIGCILYEMLSGEAPFVADNSLAMMQHHLHTPPPSVLSVLAETKTLSAPPDLNIFIAKTMAKDAAARFQSAQEARSAIEALLENAHDDLAAQREPRHNTAKETTINRIKVGVLAAISIAMLAVSSYIFMSRRKPPAPLNLSAGNNTIRLSTILQDRNTPFLDMYPIEERIRYYKQWLDRYPKADHLQRAFAYSYLTDDYIAGRYAWTTVTMSAKNATAEYREAIKAGVSSPELELAYISLAGAESKLGNSLEVINVLTKALAADSKLEESGYGPEAYRLLANAYSNQKKYDLANAAYEQALQAEAKNGFPKLIIAKTILHKAANLYNAQAVKKAKLGLRQAQQLAAEAKDPSAPPQYWIEWLRDYGLACYRMNDRAQALQVLRESRELARKAHLPEDEAIATALIADCHLSSGRRQEAMKEYQTLSNNPPVARLVLRDFVHSTVKGSSPDQPMIGEVQKCLLLFQRKTDRQKFIADLTNKDLSDLSTKEQQRFNALVKNFQEFVDSTKM